MGQQSQSPGQQPQTNPPKYDPAYERVAHGSGGQVIYMNRSDASKAAAIVDAKQNRESIAALYGQTARGSLDVPVDSFTSVLYITLSGSQAGSDLKVVNPSGRQLEEGRGAQIVRMANTVVASVDHPEPGLWRVDFVPWGVASIVATAKSDLFVATFEFVEMRGRPGHEGYLKIEGAPPAHHDVHAEFTCSDNTIRSARVELIGNDARALAFEDFHPIGSEALDEYFGKLRVPGEPFRVVIRGVDVNGAPYQRTYAPLFTPQ
jgi:hypothetical protein